jgi:type I restriction enzyme S subunit
MKHLFRERNARGFPDEPLLAATQTKGVIRKEDYESRTMLALKDLHNLKLVEVGDFVISLRSFQGGIEYARHRGIISPAYTVLHSELPDAHGYFASLLKSRPFISGLALYVTGIRQGQNIDYIKLGRSPLPVPPPAEQKAIHAFVHELDRKINRFILNRRRLIEVLNEQKQAIIHRAVTRGLDEAAPLKASGTALGDIPDDWIVLPIKRAFVSMEYGISDSGADDGTIRVLTMGNIKNGRVTVPESGGVDTVSSSLLLERGDLLFNRTNSAELVGKVGMYLGNPSPVTFASYLVRMRPTPECSPTYLNYLLNDFSILTLARSEAIPSLHQSNLNPTRYGRFLIAVPRRAQQGEIVAAIDHQTASLSAAVATAEREISLIREYRTRLIADVVTGKVDVRHFAPAEAQASLKANIYFRRSVFAAEIVHRLHDEPTFGHVKFEKTIFLCEKRCGVDTGSTYYRKAAGPYDNRALRSIDSQMKRQNWYAVEKRENRYRYVPMERAGQHRVYFDRYFPMIAERFNEVIELFRPLKTQQCEIVATLYSAWDDLLAKGDASDDQIIEQVLHHWHASKKAIEEDRWRRALGWMKRKGLTPELSVSGD